MLETLTKSGLGLNKGTGGNDSKLYCCSIERKLGSVVRDAAAASRAACDRLIDVVAYDDVIGRSVNICSSSEPSACTSIRSSGVMLPGTGSMMTNVYNFS